jgi:hypothetical protein
MALAVIALALETTTITTTMRIQPAYSQASICGAFGTQVHCVTPGRDPSVTDCEVNGCSTSNDLPRETVGGEVSFLRDRCHLPLGITCTVTPPERPK